MPSFTRSSLLCVSAVLAHVRPVDGVADWHGALPQRHAVHLPERDGRVPAAGVRQLPGGRPAAVPAHVLAAAGHHAAAELPVPAGRWRPGEVRGIAASEGRRFSGLSYVWGVFGCDALCALEPFFDLYQACAVQRSAENH